MDADMDITASQVSQVSWENLRPPDTKQPQNVMWLLG